MNERFTDREIQFISEHYRQMTDKKMGAALGRPRSSVRSVRYRNGWKKGRGIRWTDAEIDLIAKHYPRTPGKEVLSMINNAAGPEKSMSQLYTKARSLGISKDADYLKKKRKENGRRLAEAGKSSRFQKGHRPFNKGMKQEDYMSEEGIKNSSKTRFREGHRPANTKYDGAVTIRHAHPERGEAPYLWIRLSKNKWVKYHRYLEEKRNGPLADNEIVIFKDSNTLNCSPGNLERITKAQNARRNQNPEKAAESMRRHWANNPHPARDLSDNYVAHLMSGGDEDFKEYLKQRPDLLKTGRANIKLKRKINDVSTQ